MLTKMHRFGELV